MFRSVLCMALCGPLLASCGEDSKSGGDGNGGGVGNEPPRVCQTDENCDTGNICRVGACNPATRSCSYTNFDGDGDGHAPIVCGGDDCDDANPTAYPGAREIAGNSRDDNCNGRIDEAAGDDVEVDDPTCRGNEYCTVLFCGSWSWRYTELAYEEGMGDRSWLPNLRNVLLQDRTMTIAQDGCTLTLPTVEMMEGVQHDSIEASIGSSPRGFRYGESVWYSGVQSNVYCTGAINEDGRKIRSECSGTHGYAPNAEVPYTASLTITRQ